MRSPAASGRSPRRQTPVRRSCSPSCDGPSTQPQRPARHPDRDPAQRQIADLQAELRSRSWLNSGSRAWQPPVRLRDLRAAAAEGDCDLVTITQFRGRLGAVAIPAGGPMRLVELGDVETVRGWQRRLSADLDVLANAGLPTVMTAAVSRSLRHGAAELGRLLAAAFPTSVRRW